MDNEYEEPPEYSYDEPGLDKGNQDHERGGDIYYNMRHTIGGKIEAETKQIFKKKGENKLDALELGDYTKKKKASPKKKSAKKSTVVEYKSEKERIKDSINLLLKRKLEKGQRKNVNRLFKGKATR